MVSIILYELGPTRSARVRWALLEAGIPFESISEGVETFQNEALRRIHPLGKLPAVTIDGQPLFESGAIVTAVADLAPDSGLIAAPGTWERNLHYQWMCFALNELDPYANSTEVNTIDFILPKDRHVPAIKPQNNHFYQRAVAAIERHLEKQDYLVSDRFSAADIIMGYSLFWGREQQNLEGFARTNAYLDRLLQREHNPLAALA
ncbi:glutathione S-transferase family protein [Acanthopleuribacter pedis]|uniref:Glutathione S-transferase family protein n=1 Tax=Acanthopleuribacter pedis TaxID=442870 RepID=A0A8J7Q5Y4_9BACT|nr:glutathione S-transferase family protein [Acanthopleuribacter pedis]MBO1317324.1 glutathione S-transferase family protein [Acanthopleuribacter pedis]MBO1318631.1 glutathione S-transferase family protein [Acanthopleuribacter pedis]